MSGYHQEAVKAMSPSVTIVSVGQKPDTDASAKYMNYSQEVASTRWYGGITLELKATERCRGRRANSAATNQKVTAGLGRAIHAESLAKEDVR
jgi:hypothetical protein